MEELQVTPSELWPPELLYYRRMSSQAITDYMSRPPDQRLLIVVWGVLEAHGPYKPLATDSLHSSVVADVLSRQLRVDYQLTPVIFDSFMDIGSPSATQDYSGSMGFTSQPVPIIQTLWEQFLTRMVHEGFTRVFLVNGDGGNWANHWARLHWDSMVIRQLKQVGLSFDGCNWDGEAGLKSPHGGEAGHARNNWFALYAPKFIRVSALRHGLAPIAEEDLQKLDGAQMLKERKPTRWFNWAQQPGQDRLRGVTKFDYQVYRDLLFNPDGLPLTDSGIVKDFEVKMDRVIEVALNVMKGK